MTQPRVKEVSAPYVVNPDDEAIGRETVIIRRNGEPVAAIVPYAEYQSLIERKPAAPISNDAEFERNRAAFNRLLPELLKAHRGEWVAIVDEQPVEFGATSEAVLNAVYERLGHVRLYVQQVLEKPPVYRITNRRVVRPSLES